MCNIIKDCIFNIREKVSRVQKVEMQGWECKILKRHSRRWGIWSRGVEGGLCQETPGDRWILEKLNLSLLLCERKFT